MTVWIFSRRFPMRDSRDICIRIRMREVFSCLRSVICLAGMVTVKAGATYVELQYGYSSGSGRSGAGKGSVGRMLGFSEGLMRVDLGIHYEGWDVNDVSTFLGSLGLQDKTLAQDLFDTIAPDPASYPAYYVGYLEFMNLRDLAEKAGSIDV